jgi:hypothetical protein
VLRRRRTASGFAGAAERALMPDTNVPTRAELHEPTPPATSTSTDSAPAPLAVSRVSIWLHRLLVLLFVFICAATGVLLVILPWLPQWGDNSLLTRFPGLRPLITHGFFRGICSGLGLLDIWIGFSEAIHYHEDKLP